MDALASQDERGIRRTAKPCGPGAPTLASSLWSDPQAMVARKPGHQGERGISRKPLRREGRIVSANLWRLRSCAFLFACEAMGAASTRLSLRPLFAEALRPASL